MLSSGLRVHGPGRPDAAVDRFYLRMKSRQLVSGCAEMGGGRGLLTASVRSLDSSRTKAKPAPSVFQFREPTNGLLGWAGLRGVSGTRSCESQLILHWDYKPRTRIIGRILGLTDSKEELYIHIQEGGKPPASGILAPGSHGVRPCVGCSTLTLQCRISGGDHLTGPACIPWPTCSRGGGQTAPQGPYR